MMLHNIIIVTAFLFCFQLGNGLRFDCYSGTVASLQLIAYYKSRGLLDVCTTEIETCRPTERRRVDGSCNCLSSPSRGTFFKPLIRVLPAHYHNGSYPRKACSGKDLLWPRTVRRILLAEGKTSDCHFTQAITSYGIFMFLDIGSVHDISQFVFVKTDCCTEKGRKDYECSSNFVDAADTLNRLGGITCLNLTRPLTFQSLGCSNDPVPAPIVHATSTFDASQIYNFLNKGDKVIREYRGGRIIVEVENGKIWPQNGPSSNCPLNNPDETRCFKNHPNILLIQTLFVVWFVRFHNYCALQLARVNPCWDDETLFQVSRDITISVSLQIYLHGWAKSLLGEYLVKSGVISKEPGFRNIYDPTKCPGNTLEFTFIMRYLHVGQESKAKLFDKYGRYVKDESIFAHTTHTGFLAKGNYMELFTQSQFRQSCAKINDCTIDNDVADNGLPSKLQKSVDIAASDLHKSRLLGLRSYIDYLHYCTGQKITCFDDLRGHVDDCKIEELKKVYEDVCDIDLMAGMWVEKVVPGGFLPRTFACLFSDNMVKAIKADRHWYEHEHRPYAFTLKQLLEIRKATLSMMLCLVADGVTEVQLNAFVGISAENPLKKCREIPSINFTAWADKKCSSHSSSSSDEDTLLKVKISV